VPNTPLNAFDAFRAGTRTDASGARVTITAKDLSGSAAAYDPSIRPAPLGIGHPKREDPAYGWLRSRPRWHGSNLKAREIRPPACGTRVTGEP
jgi:hypothetical protein